MSKTESQKRKRQASTRIIPIETIQDRILLIRGHKVLLDADLAALYGVSTKRLNEQVKRNQDRFPADFMFQLTEKELKQLTDLRSHFATSKSHGGRRYLPYAFTEHGAIMAATVLSSQRAVAMSIYVVRAFVEMRNVFVANQILETRLAQIEKTLLAHDGALRDLYKKIRPLLLPPQISPKRRIGFYEG